MSAEYGVSRQAMHKRFNKLGIETDLRERIEFARNSILEKSVVDKEVDSEVTSNRDNKIIVDANANLQANIIIGHRKDIQAYRKLTAKLSSELELVSDNRELFEALHELLIETTLKERGTITIKHSLIHTNLFAYLHTYAIA